jgi:hypothetical protein
MRLDVILQAVLGVCGVGVLARCLNDAVARRGQNPQDRAYYEGVHSLVVNVIILRMATIHVRCF